MFLKIRSLSDKTRSFSNNPIHFFRSNFVRKFKRNIVMQRFFIQKSTILFLSLIVLAGCGKKIKTSLINSRHRNFL